MRRLPAVLGLLALLATGGLTACSDDDPDTRSAEGNGAVAEQARPVTPEELGDRLLTIEATPPIGRAEVTLPFLERRHRFVAEILEVRDTGTSTVLRWRLRAPDGRADTTPGVFSRKDTDADTSGVALVPAGTKERFVPGLYDHGTWSYSCTCARQPWSDGPAGVEMSAVYAPMGRDVREVDVHIPEFPPITVPVTRA